MTELVLMKDMKQLTVSGLVAIHQIDND